MHAPSISRDALGSAEELLVDFLAGGDARGEAFETFCARHGEHEGELRRLYAEWAQLDRLLGGRGVAAGREQAASVPAAAVDDLLEGLARSREPGQRYVLGPEVARGGMGVIYKAWDQSLRRHVAMKVLRRDSSALGQMATHQRERLLGRFFEEAQITGQLEHPGIVPVHEIGLDAEERLYFTMPLVRGIELTKVIQYARTRREGWNPTRALAVFLKVCEAVAYAHSKGVVHRDLKPSNVMVGPFGETYVMDWGLAHLVARQRAWAEAEIGGSTSQLIDTDVREKLESTPDSPLVTQKGAVIGTPAYMSPEQAGGDAAAVGPRSDVYAIGAMLYQLLTGEIPYASSVARLRAEALLTARLKGPPPSVLALAPDAPAELAAICAKAMESVPQARYATALELAQDLEAFLARRPVGAVDASLAYVLRLACRRNAKLVAAIAAGVFVSLGLGARDVVNSRAAAADIRQLADLDTAKVLLRESGELVAVPERVGAIREWLERSQGVLERAGSFASAAELRPEAAQHRQEHLANVASLLRLHGDMEERLVRAATLEERSFEAHRAAWDGAIASIASLPIYRGLLLAPQRGLAPLQWNPSTGLWEFWVIDSGSAPRIADAASGRLALDADSALVLVLLPGGPFTVGSASDEPGRYPNEERRELELPAYFLGKSEVPQSVWRRAMGSNPSQYQSAETYLQGPPSPLLPVEYVDWSEGRDFLARFELELPSEAQWEYAARCGDLEPFRYGRGETTCAFDGRENLLDVETARAELTRTQLGILDDGFRATAPVMSLAPNAFGLHDLFGNVSEWCADSYAAACDASAPSDTFRVFRGGYYYSQNPAHLRSAFRQWDLPKGRNQSRGLRAARPVR